MEVSARARRTESPHTFDVARYRHALVAIVRAIEALPEDADDPRGAGARAAALDRILRAHPRDGRGFFSRSQIIEGFRTFASAERFALDERAFVRRVRLRPVRTQSGVTPVTVLTKPFPCPGRCVFCPNDVRMPKSYLADEPGAQRAAQSHFDPYAQAWGRLAAYHAIGHPVDKVELIVLGGTWSAYPEAYQRWFARRCFDALSDFGDGVDGRASSGPSVRDWDALRADAGRDYNETVSAHLRDRLAGRLLEADEQTSWGELEAAQRRNERARCRSVGFVIETRPDHVDADEPGRLRRLGVTKIQLGLQSLSDEVLRANRRGHDVAATVRAFRRLRAAGFKLHAHWMPNLLGATPGSDVREAAQLFADESLRPDELKIYPCSLVETAELMQHHASGAWRPYTDDELLDVVTAALLAVPRWCRVTRVIRDISSDDIVVGNKRTNFREIAEAELARRGRRAVDIRAREIRGEPVDPARLRLRETRYATSVGEECFLEQVDRDDRVAGFLRLSLPDAHARDDTPAELRERAVVREVHVYGEALALGTREAPRAQHRGLGRALVEAAAERARAAGFAELSVISAVGTREWYRRLGFADGALYQHLALG